MVVTHNRVELLKDCITGILKQTARCDILIVDNGSNDQTKSYIESLQNQYDFVDACFLNENIGGAGGFFNGIKLVALEKYEYCWIMDDDAMPTRDCLKNLLDAATLINSKKISLGFLCSKVLWTDGSECKMNLPKFKKCEKEPISSILKSVTQATFVSLLIPVSVVTLVGLPIKEYFIWGDDIEYTRRIAVRNSLSSYLVTNSVVIHKTSNNVGSNIAKDSADRIQKYNYAFRNENHLYRQEGLRGFVYYTLKCIFNALRVLLFSRTQKIERLKVIAYNYFTGRNFSPSIEYLPKEET